MSYAKGYTLDSTPGGDTVKEAIIDKLDALGIDGIYTGLNAHELLTTGAHGVGAGAIVGTTLTQVLTNKTLTTPVIASLYIDAGKTKLMTFPDVASDTVVMLAATQTLSGKTHSGTFTINTSADNQGLTLTSAAGAATLLIQGTPTGGGGLTIRNNSNTGISLTDTTGVTINGTIINMTLTQASMRFTNTTRTWDLQAVTTGDYFRILIGGTGDGFKLDSTGNATIYNNLTVSGLTASKFVKTTAGKVLSSVDIATTDVQFSATDKLLGRSTAGAGAGEEIACTAAARSILDDASTAAILATLGAMGYADARFKIGLTTHDVSLTGGDAVQVVTGVGFQPKAIIMLTSIAGTAGNSIGFDDGTSHICVIDNHNVAADTWSVTGSYSINLYTGGANIATGVVSALGADGFTITWAKSSSPTGTAYVLYLAIR